MSQDRREKTSLFCPWVLVVVVNFVLGWYFFLIYFLVLVCIFVALYRVRQVPPPQLIRGPIAHLVPTVPPHLSFLDYAKITGRAFLVA